MAYEGTENIYLGSPSPLEPTYGELFTGYRIPASEIFYSTDPRTAAQVNEVATKLNAGMRGFEISAISPEVFESIPKEHLKEINRLGKLTGANFTLHGPIIDPAGFTNDGWSEVNRENVERQMKRVIERAHDLDPKGNIPVTFHATIGIPSTTLPKPAGVPPTEEDVIYVINKETGQITGFRREKRYYPETKKEEWLTPAKQIEEANRKMWDRQFGSIAWETIRAREYIDHSASAIAPIIREIETGKIKEEDLSAQQRTALGEWRASQTMYDDIGAHIKAFYNDAMRLWDENTKKEHAAEINQIRDHIAYIENKRLTDTNPIEAARRYDEVIRIFRNLVKKAPPQIYSPTEDFAREKGRETLANVALYAYKKFGDKAPIISIENVFPNTVFGTGSELAKFIKDARDTFVKKAQKEGISESRANEIANKLIGATWDTGHIFMARKYGLTPEMIVEETKKIAPFVKHVHISDNFGFEHTELPPGMGEVPMKDMLRELEKAGYSGKKIIEAGSWFQHFRTMPTPYVLEAFGSPIYEMQMQPFWNQARGMYEIPAPYSSGYGLMLPEQHMGIYGAGFASVPMELGGQTAGRGQRFSGVPME